LGYLNRKFRMPKWLDWLFTIVGLGAVAGGIIWLEGASTQSLSGRAYVVDGDSLEINQQRIRLKGIDAPELHQTCLFRAREWACGRESREFLRRSLRGRLVDCEAGTIDDYDRWLAVCYVEGKNINKMLVAKGWAVEYGAYRNDEKAAKAAKIGMWKGSFERPRAWRDAQWGSASGLIYKE